MQNFFGRAYFNSIRYCTYRITYSNEEPVSNFFIEYILGRPSSVLLYTCSISGEHRWSKAALFLSYGSGLFDLVPQRNVSDIAERSPTGRRSESKVLMSSFLNMLISDWLEQWSTLYSMIVKQYGFVGLIQRNPLVWIKFASPGVTLNFDPVEKWPRGHFSTASWSIFKVENWHSPLSNDPPCTLKNDPRWKLITPCQVILQGWKLTQVIGNTLTRTYTYTHSHRYAHMHVQKIYAAVGSFLNEVPNLM